MSQPSTVKMSISVTPQQRQEIRKLVESGGYTNDSEVIRDGLRLLFSRNRSLMDEDAFDEKIVRALARLDQDPARRIPIKNAHSAFQHALEEKTGSRKK